MNVVPNCIEMETKYHTVSQRKRKLIRADKIMLDGSFYPVSLVPNREYPWIRVRLSDWYGKLGIGHYQLTVRKRLVPNGDWVESNPVTFDVILKVQRQSSPGWSEVLRNDESHRSQA